jgi:hypothetical protein
VSFRLFGDYSNKWELRISNYLIISEGESKREGRKGRKGKRHGEERTGEKRRGQIEIQKYIAVNFSSLLKAKMLFSGDR